MPPNELCVHFLPLEADFLACLTFGIQMTGFESTLDGCARKRQRHDVPTDVISVVLSFALPTYSAKSRSRCIQHILTTRQRKQAVSEQDVGDYKG